MTDFSFLGELFF